jgi:hypothetical protein
VSETESETTYVESRVVCHTDGCANAGHEIDLLVAEGGAVACGVCGQEITDVTPTAAPR